MSQIKVVTESNIFRFWDEGDYKNSEMTCTDFVDVRLWYSKSEVIEIDCKKTGVGRCLSLGVKGDFFRWERLWEGD